MRELHGDLRDLFLGFRIALDPSKMLLGLVGLIFSFAGLAVIAYGGTRVGLRGDELTTLERALSDGDLDGAWQQVCKGLGSTLTGDLPDARTGERPSDRLRTAQQAAARAGKPLARRAPWWRRCLLPGPQGGGINWFGLAVALAAIVWLSFVWAKFGGAIARICAVEAAKDERLPANEALRFAKHRFGSFFWSPLSVVALIGLLVFLNAFGGLIGRIPYLGDVLVAVGLPLAFGASLVILFLSVGGALGWPLMAPALATEGTDAFDAVSRSFSYVYSRPWHYLFYGACAKVYGAICCAVVWLFALLLVRLTFFTVGLGMHLGAGPHRKLDLIAAYMFGRSGTRDDGTAVTIGEVIAGGNHATVVLLVVMVVIVLFIYGLAAGYMVSFAYTAKTLIYLVLRKKVDATEMDEVWLDEEREPAVAGGDPPDPAPAPTAGTGTAVDPAQQAAADAARAAGGDAPAVGEKPEE